MPTTTKTTVLLNHAADQKALIVEASQQSLADQPYQLVDQLYSAIRLTLAANAHTFESPFLAWL